DSKIMQTLVDQWYALNAPGVPPARFVTGPGYAQARHAQAMLDYDNLMGIAQKFWDLVWIVGYNRTGSPFYTSDDPVVRRVHPVVNETSAPLPPGIGIEYAYPLNSQLILMMFDRWKFKSLESHERKTLEFDPEHV